MRDLEFFLKHTKENGDCLEWTRCFNTDGYPRCAWNGSSNGKVHRIVYELVHKKDITGLVVRHKCDNPKCLNPEHLEIGTPSDNTKDRDERNRTYKRYTEEFIAVIKEIVTETNLSDKVISKLLRTSSKRISDIRSGKLK